MTKLLYKAMTLVISVLSGMLAWAIFKRVWKLAVGEGRGAHGHRRPARVARGADRRGAPGSDLRAGQGGREPCHRRRHPQAHRCLARDDGGPEQAEEEGG